MYIVGVSGGSGSGKTSILKELRATYGPADLAIISQDDYYLPADRSADNHTIDFDRPEALDMDRLYADICRLTDGGSVVKTEYTFNNSSKDPASLTIPPAAILVVEGLFVFHHEGIRELCDQLVFVDAPKEVRFDRRLRRDMSERGYSAESIKYKWENQVERGFLTYLYPHRDKAHVIIDNTHSYAAGVREICAMLDRVLDKVDSK